ncbi:DUF3782 domain-containing protein [Lamprobacter modestohalophilus]|uniref:PD-(D/E)XK nuclease family protein n=1 Tax=Lamprobacter modestohalophilus TaxID=1064514 RepID=UPI002ADEE090|nr:DUF3782 domain-containing protein [Lamprobacter modestohalophilus]MEA1051535.1 DUF3782 domain-containing protein [Lamprobacter modestohalophilus]
MSTDEKLKQDIKRELPELLRSDPDFRAWIMSVTSDAYAGRQQTESRFDQVLAELRRDREEQSRRWAEQKAEDKRKWAEQKAAEKSQRAEQKAEDDRKWVEQKAEDARKWAEQKAERERDREEQNRKWEENNAHFERVHEEIMANAKKVDRGIGALGARWGIQSERAFRDALAGILQENFGVEVLHIDDYDESGQVFGRPEQVELDIIIQNGQLLICELKSSIDKAGMYIFERKARFYEQRHGRKATRLIVISPMIDHRAKKVAEKLGIDTYGDSLDVETL